MNPRQTIALDSNVLALYLVGRIDSKAVAKHRRLSKFDESDFDLLQRLLAPYESITVTPGVLAETSDLLRYDRSDDRAHRLLVHLLKDSESGLEESNDTLTQAASRTEALWLGLVDASLIDVAERGIPLITADFKLYAQVSSANTNCINFDALRLNS